MTTFATGYLIVWLAFVLYLARLGRHQRQLARDLELLRDQVQAADPEERTARAA